MNTHIGSDLCLLTDEELDVVAGGQQLYRHEFPGAVDRQTGLRPGEPPSWRTTRRWVVFTSTDPPMAICREQRRCCG